MAVIQNAKNSLQLLVEEEVASLPLGLYPMINRLQKKVISQKVIQWNTNVGGATVVGEPSTASINTYSEDVVVGASLSITNRLRHSFQIQKEDISEASAAGKGVLRDLFGYEIQSGLRALMESMSGLVYTGTGTSAQGGIVGLGAVVANAAYAGIDPATYPLWSAVLNSNGTNRALTTDLLFAVEAAILRKGGNFTALYTTPEIAARYKSLFAANLSINNVLPPGQVDLGYTGLSYSGRPVIQDPYAPNNTIYFVNEPEVALYTFNQNNTSSREGLQIAIERLPSSNPDAENYAVYLKPQLKVHNRAKGVAGLTAITQ